MEEEELKEIMIKMNEYSEKYNCMIEVERYETRHIDDVKGVYVYRLQAIEPEKVIAEC